MTIGCLGWGSLIWDPGTLPIRGEWHDDGPLLPVEFARQSKNGRLTLVVVPGYSSRVRSLWALLAADDVVEAAEALRQRENVPEANREKHISAWSVGQSAPGECPEMPAWASSHGLTSVVWTALPPKFGDEERPPTIDEAVEYLKRLPLAPRQAAERYIRMAPRQEDTPYRRRFEAEFGWTATG